MRRAIKLISTYIGLSAFICLMWVILSYPDIPSTAGQWLSMLALALPLQLAGEFVGELLWKNRATRLVEQKTAAKSFSLFRILYGVLLLLVFIGLTLGAGYVWRVLRPLTGV